MADPRRWRGCARGLLLLPLAALVVALAGCAGAGEEEGAPETAAEAVAARLRLAGSPLPEPLEKPDLVLRDTEGEPFDLRAETEGYLTLLFFGYTSCPDICPVHLANIAGALDAAPFDVRRQVKVVFVAVDPPRDRPDAVRDFLDHFDSDFVGLVGSAEELERAQRAASVPPAFVDAEWEDGYSVSHAGWVTLYTRDGVGRLRYPFGTRQREWAHDLEVLVRRGWPRT